MSDTLLDFIWEVPGNGFEWVNTRAAKGQWILAAPKTPDRLSARQYQPLRAHTGLFRTFAGTEPTSEAVKSFADQFGLLGLYDTAREVFVRSKKGSSDEIIETNGERLQEWADAIGELSRLLTLWDLARLKDKKRLAQHVSWWNADQIAITPNPDGKGRSALELIEGDDAKRFRHGDLIRPVLEYVRRAVNAQLPEMTSPQLDWKDDGSGLRLSYSPKNLIGAVWLQLALAISAPKEFRNCRTCGRPFEISREPTTGRRADSVFCSDACKSRDYRNRQRNPAPTQGASGRRSVAEPRTQNQRFAAKSLTTQAMRAKTTRKENI